jgi:hypothetical protein
LVLLEQQIKEGIDRVLRAETTKLKKYLGLLATVAGVAPFIGLFGTVLGIIRAFHDIAAKGFGGPSVVAAGIAEALIATAAGLFVAIPTLIAFNYFVGASNQLMVRVENFSLDLFLGLLLGLEEEQVSPARAGGIEEVSVPEAEVKGLALPQELADRIGRLVTIFKRGLITKEEFIQQKERLMGEISTSLASKPASGDSEE